MQAVLHSFNYCVDFIAEQIADVPEADMMAQPAGILNHPAWTIAHLTVTFEQIGGVVGVEPWLPSDWLTRFWTGSAPTTDRSAYPPKADALAMLHDARTRLVGAVERAAEAHLDAPFPDPAYRDLFPTIRHALTQVLIGHTSYHVGQLSAWRKAMRRPPLPRAFD